LVDFKFNDSDIDTCIIQFRALGLVRESQKTRSIKDTNTYWSLTPYGDQLMTQLRALKRTNPKLSLDGLKEQNITENK
jgi:hypothetical protein